MLNRARSIIKRLTRLSYRTVLGVDLGASAIKIVELNCEREPPMLKNYAIIELPFEQGETPTAAFYADLLRRSVYSHGFQAKQAFVSVSEQNSLSREIDFPPLTGSELAEAVKWEAQAHIPFEAGSYYYDFAVTKAKSTVGSRVMLAAAQKEAIDQLIGICNEASIPIIAIESEAFAIERTLPRAHPLIVIDFGRKNSRMMLFQHRLPIAIRRLPVSGDDFSRLEAAADCEDARHGPLEALTREIEQTIAHGRMAAQQLAFHEILLCGGAAGCQALSLFLAARTGLSVRSLCSPSALTVSPSLDREQLWRVSPRLTVAIGLALRGVTT